MLLPFGGVTIIETVVRTALASSADEVIVVLGTVEDKIREALAHLPVTFAVNNEYHQGMLSSIQCGLRQLSSNTSAVLVMLGDQPAIPSEAVDCVIEAWRSSGKGLVLPTYDGHRGHPLLVAMRYHEEALNLDPSAGMRALLAAHKEDILYVPVETATILKDIDTPEDYAEQTADSESA